MKEYIDKIHEKINKLEYEHEDKLSKEILLELAIPYILDEVDTTELLLTSYDNEFFDLRLDGCDLLNDQEIIFYISDYADSEYELSEDKVNHYLKQVTNYYLKAKNDLGSKLNDADLIANISHYINAKHEQINKIHIYIISSNQYIGGSVFPLKCGKVDLDIKIFDACFLKEHGFLSEYNEDNLTISFSEPLNYVKCEAQDDNLDVYLMFMKGEDIARIYEEYGYVMLEGNVRTYLKKTSKQNKGIFETISSEPHNFVAYNNGLSTVATALEIENNAIKNITGWKIVNGGQTTATIYEAYKAKGGKLNQDIYVPVKLTVLKQNENSLELISKIAEYANTQNKVSQSDLSSNEKYHYDLEKLSKTCCVPSKIEGKKLKKWFYERLRGQYNLSMSRALNKEVFELEYPSENVFDKKDLAKAVMAWEQEPYTTALGKEKCFSVFSLRIKANADNFTLEKKDYQKIIALIILYREIEKIVKELRYGGFNSNITEYTMSVLSLISNKRIDLNLIWNEQKVPSKLQLIIKAIAYDVTQIITDVPENQKNVQMYCRQTRCWQVVKNNDYKIEIPNEFLTDDNNTILDNSSTTIINGEQIDINTIDTQVWADISQWGKETGLLTPTERSMAYSAYKISKVGYKWKSDKQRDFAKSVFNKAISKGYVIKESN